MFEPENGDVFTSDEKKRDDVLLNMIGYGVIIIIIGIGLFFVVPSILLSILLCMIANRYLPKKIIYFTSGISLISFIGTIYLWSYQPLFQFGILWRALMPKIVAKIEELVQGGRVFNPTMESYIMLILMSLILVSVWLIIASKLKKNWFTKEKEQEKDNYMASDSYKKIYKNKEKYVRRIQKKYRKKNQNQVCIGMDIKGKSVLFDTSNLFKHCLIQGTTGTGKTNMMYNIMEAALRKAMGLIFINGKGDPKGIKEIEKIANFYDKRVYVFSDESKWHYNPVKYGKPTSVTDRLMAVMDWSEQFYEKESKNILQQIISFLQDYNEVEKHREHIKEQGEPLKMDLETIHRFLDLTEIANYLFIEQEEHKIQRKHQPRDNEELDGFLKKGQVKTKQENEEPQLYQKYIKIFFKKKTLTLANLDEIKEAKDEQIKLIRGLRTQLELLIYSDLGEKFKEVEGKTLDVKEIIQNGDIVTFSLDSNNYSSFIDIIGRFIIADCAYITTELYGKTEGFKGALGIFDEFGSYGNDNIIDILSKARSAKFGAVLGIQSISDLENKRKNIDIKKQTIDNCNTFILGRTNSPKNAEEISMLIGTYQDVDRTIMTENQGGKLARIETKSEKGTVRKVNKFEFSPDNVKNLPDYQFFYVNKNLEKDNKKKVFARNVFEDLN